MKIGIIFSTVFASPAYSGDRIFAPRQLLTDLADSLLSRGHDVTVFTAADFPTAARIVSPDMERILHPLEYYKFRRADESERRIVAREFAKRNFELDTITAAFAAAAGGEVDVLHQYHDSSQFFTHHLEQFSRVPLLYTLHDPLPPEGSFEHAEFARFTGHSYVSISNAFRIHPTLKLTYTDTVYHGLRLSDFPVAEKASDYVLFMGRLVPEKGLHDAIQAAIASGTMLEVGTNFPDHDHESGYFKTQVKPYLDNPFIGEPGMVKGDDKTLLYKEARALLFPIHWEEPFGMVMIEAMACGTPVIAYNRGSVPEVVRDGTTGFIIDENDDNRPGKGSFIIKKQGVDGLVEAIRRIGEIDRAACRKHVEEHFSVAAMTDGYEAVYRKVLGG